MTRARSIFGLYVALSAVGAVATALALFAATTVITVSGTSPAKLLDACRSFVLPRVTVSSAVALALGSVAFAALALAARSAVRQVRASRAFLRGLEVVGPLRTGGGLVIADERSMAFCAGLLRPQVYVSRGALESLTQRELEAVLAHEAHHARFRDPLRIFFARVLSEALFFLPALRKLSDRYAALAELAADEAAVRRHEGDTKPLAAALLAFDAREASSAVVGIAPERIDHLLGERTRWELPIALLAWSAVAVSAIIVVALRTADASTHPMFSLPLVATQLCMFLMAVVPLMLGSSALLGGGRLVRTLRR